MPACEGLLEKYSKRSLSNRQSKRESRKDMIATYLRQEHRRTRKEQKKGQTLT